MNIKKVCIGLALMLPILSAPVAMAQGCSGNYGQSSWMNGMGYGPGYGNGCGFGNGAGFGNGNGNGFGNGNWQRKMQRKMARRAWRQRQLAANDPYFNYWNQHPGQYQSLWRSQQEMANLMNGGIISPQEKALLEAQLQAYQGLNGAVIPAGYYNDPYGYSNANNGGVLGGLVNGLAGNGMGLNAGNPFVNAAVPGILDRLASYWGGNGLGF